MNIEELLIGIKKCLQELTIPATETNVTNVLAIFKGIDNYLQEANEDAEH